MSRVLMLVEGPTERAIVSNVFAPVMGEKGIFLYPRVVGKPGHKGGNKFSSVLREIKMLLLQEPSSTVTMLFDYYGLSKDWPGLSEAKRKRQTSNIPSVYVENGLSDVLIKEMGAGFNLKRFIPYIQLYEIESLLFAGTDEMAFIFGKPDLSTEFEKIVNDSGGCEKINNNPEKTPSKRIQSLFPRYKKGSGVNAHASRILNRMGVSKIRQKCPHFNEWWEKLENITK